MRQPSKADRTDAQWKPIQPLIPPAKLGGRPREVDMREILKTLLSQARTGCPWELLPHDLPPKSTVSDSLAQGRDDGTWQRIVDALRREVRVAEGRDPTPSAAAIDSQSVQAAAVGGAHGSDAGRNVSGRERHVVVDPSGLLMAVVVTAASADDGATWPGVHPERFRVEVVKRPFGTKGFVPLPRRWVSGRSFAWSGRDRRQGEDSESLTESSASWVRISAIGPRLRGRAPDESRIAAPFKSVKEKAA